MNLRETWGQEDHFGGIYPSLGEERWRFNEDSGRRSEEKRTKVKFIGHK